MTTAVRTMQAALPKPHEAYRRIALVLQGGGALGSYQAGVYQGLDEAGILPNWVAGISIGALNAAVIAGNAPEHRVAQLDAFWSHICRQPWSPLLPVGSLAAQADHWPVAWRRWWSSIESSRALLEGQNGFFVPRLPPPPVWPELGDVDRAGYYDTAPLRDTLERFADFDRINRPELMRVSVGAVQVRTGNFVYFDNTERRLGPEHFMASGALPPGFPPVRVGDEHYWDGGLVSNTPLLHVLTSEPRQDTLAFQVDLWSARGKLPTTMPEVAERQKEIQYSSRTRLVTNYMREQQTYRRRLSELLAMLTPAQRKTEAARHAALLACDRRCNVLQLIYQDKPYEGDAKDYEFGQLALRDHWRSGLEDLRHTLDHPEWLAMPSADEPFVTHDVHRLHPRP
jgi:NTE family protein